jgi:SagB-type dehydrogenase family enzyme
VNPFLNDNRPDPYDAEVLFRAHIAGDLDETASKYQAPADLAATWRPERKAYPRFPPVELPDVPTAPSRRSVRRFRGRTVPLEALAHVIAPLFTDISSPSVRPACPSAGALLPVEAYVLPERVERLNRMVHYVDTENRQLTELFAMPDELLDDGDVLGCTPVPGAAFFVCLTGVLYRSFRKYGARSYRYINQEAGALALAIDRQTSRFGLGSCWLGGFADSRLTDLLGLQPALEFEVPLLLLAVGEPA